MLSEERPLRFRGPEGLELTGVCWSGAEPARGPELLFTPGNGFPVQVYREVLAGLAGSGPAPVRHLYVVPQLDDAARPGRGAPLPPPLPPVG